MKVTLEATGTFETVNGVQTRLWQGATAEGVPVKAWIAVVQPQTHDPAALKAFETSLREVKADRRLVSFDIRLVL